MVKPGQVSRYGPVVTTVAASDLQGNKLSYPRLQLVSQGVLIQATAPSLHIVLKIFLA